ncbi:MAG: S9 family peptidase [Candidatus Acidiferrales bacterium]|jgi:dipeptidyl aminopeptidase/acylaminoacyl peptidase
MFQNVMIKNTVIQNKLIRTAFFCALLLAIPTALTARPQEQETPAAPARPAAAPHPKPARPAAAGQKPAASSTPQILPGTPEAKAVAAMFAVHTFAQADISPDGKQVAWVEHFPEANGAASANSEIYVAEVENPAAARRITAGLGGAPHSEGDVAWSPDSKRLAFLSDAAKPGQQELYTASAAGGAARKLTQLKGFLSTPGWSPDGKTIALLFIENAARAAGPLVAETPDLGVISDEVHEQRLTLVDAAKGTARQISPPDMYIYEYDWSPDSTRFITTAANGNGDDNWYIAALYTIDAASGASQLVYKPDLQIAEPRWSPGGGEIAFIAGLMSDEGSVGGDIYVLSIDGGVPRDITEKINASPSWLTWINGGRQILFAAAVDGRSGIASVEVASAQSRVLWSGVETISASGYEIGLSLARDGETMAFIRQSFVHPPEVWAGQIGDWSVITKANATLEPEWGPAQSLHWTSDGQQVQGWLLYPPDVDPSLKYPLVVAVHGGPAAMVSPRWPTQWSYTAALVAAGFFVLEPNPRGSYGSGEAFTRANVKDFGYGDFRDIMAGVDQSLSMAPIDANRVGITGWSYGGYMTMWAVTQTDRFHAAMAGAGLANFQSYYGENKIDQWMIPYFGASVYDDPAVYAKSSPITFIKKATTPTLVVVGERDGECPAPQSFEFWHALKANGTTTEFVVYPNEGHRFANPEHTRDVIARTLAWFRHYL